MTSPVSRPLVFVPALTLLVGLVLGLSFRGGSEPAPVSGTEETATLWTCSMHPQIRLPGPGRCPICGMDLIPLAGGGVTASTDPSRLTLSETARKLAEVETEPAQRREVSVTVRTVGKLEADETRVREISAWVRGRIDKLHVDYTGVPIRAGEPLFDLYSPEVFAAEEELLQAVVADTALARSPLTTMRRSSARTVDASREKLRLLGLSPAQIADIEKQGAPSEHVTVLAPVSGVVVHKAAVQGSYVETGTHVYTIADLSVLWLQLDVYESDLEWVKLGQTVAFETDTYPGVAFPGRVSFIDPVLTEQTRSVKVRVEVSNPDGRLKPGMFARARIEAPVPGPSGGLPLVVPDSAPLVTGTRAIVYVAVPGQPGTYEGREITLGPRAGAWWVVRDGLREGERVVVRGNFKIDSELQIRAGRSMMSPAGGGPGPAAGDAGPPTGIAAAAVPPVVQEVVGSLLSIYYDVAGSLSGDDLARAARAADRLAEAARAARFEGDSAEMHRAWDREAAELATQAVALARAPNLDSARIPLEPLSDAMIRIVKGFGGPGTEPVYVIHCPMAHGHGADWLQPKPETANPYFGASMLTCGAVAETLRAGSAPPREE